MKYVRVFGVAGEAVIVETSSATMTPRASDGASFNALDLTREYTTSIQTSSYNEIWDKIHRQSLREVQLLHPDQESVKNALQHALPIKLTHLVSNYFEISEHASSICLFLQQSINQARSLYQPVVNLFEHIPSSSSITQQQCNWAFDTLDHFLHQGNPFPSKSNIYDICQSFSQLKCQLDSELHKAYSHVRMVRYSRRCSAICLIGSVLAVAITAVVIATHALGALAAIPCLTIMPTKETNELYISQLSVAARGTYVLQNDLSTIDRLVARLHASVESDKDLIRYGIEHGKDKYPILEVVRQLQKNHQKFLHQLKDLEEHICLCFIAINRGRSLLLREIDSHKAHNSQQYCT